MLPARERQISDLLPASSSKTTLTQIPLYCLSFVASFLSPHVARFLALLVGRLYFCETEKLTVSLAIGDAVFRDGDITVGFSK